MNADPEPPVPLDGEWWTHPEVQPALAVRDFQWVYGWLQRQGWSQTRIAAAAGQSQPEVSAIVHGRQVQAYAVMVRIADGFGIPRGYLGLSHCRCAECTGAGGQQHGDGSEDGGDDPVERRRFVGAVAAVAAGGALGGADRWLPGRPSGAAVPGRVGASEVAQVRAVTAQLRATGRRFGGGMALDAALGFAGWAHRMLGSRYSSTVGRDLRLALGELHALIGWTQHDVRNPAATRRHYFQVLVLARDADTPELAADALSDLAQATVESRNPYEGLRLARIGLAAAAERVSPVTVAALYLVEARAWAQLGDERGLHDAVARTEESLSRVDLTGVPEWAAAGRLLLNPGHLAGVRLEMYEELSRHRPYGRYAETAIELEPAARLDDPARSYRGAVLNQVSLAAAQLRAGYCNQGLTTSYRVLDKIAALRSTRARTRLNTISNALAALPAIPDTDDLRARLAGLTEMHSYNAG